MSKILVVDDDRTTRHLLRSVLDGAGFSTSVAKDGVDALKALPPEIVSKAGGPVKAALKAAANLLRDEAIRNVVKIVLEPNDSGIPYDGTLTLAKNIVAGRSKPAPGVKGERFAVRVRKVSYPVTEGAKPISTPQVGRLLEYGSERLRNPKSWIRLAFDSKKGEALKVFEREMVKRTTAAIKRAERMARGKR